ncbi:SAM-dependent methyltransferase [Amnibacterium flavum]|uniref:SAM-dependent methyltransferase n=1 Tax=Amnibacterium flavum TaxID=2173173 RepID=A0A2V1HTP2_9MICO|nr:class I SAM-dependent methyltransferase [Amnibacterium flavum]PVZ95052.1 SAM-dependent methyltransferase [Amnibacterium flavum]
MLPDEARQLLSSEGLALLDRIGGYGSASDVLRISTALRREGHPPDLIAAVLTQARLRQRAAAKFGPFADRMLFTEAGLEQATRLPVAALHAGRYRSAGLTRIGDLGCGIGGDAMAMAAIDLEVVAVDRDEVTAAFAAYNLAPFEGAEVRIGSAEETDLSGIDGVFLDPARRTAGHGGTSRLGPDDWSPSLGFAFGLGDRVPTGVKLAPGMDRELIPDGAEAEWVTIDGDTVELAVWFGALARPGVTRSAVVQSGGATARIDAPADTEDPEPRELGRYLHEPAGSVIRGRLIGDVARRLDAGLVHPGIAYLTGDRPSPDPLAASFEIREVLPLDERGVARTLRSLDIGTLEIKKRGVDIDPAQFRKRLGLRGPGQATLVLTRLGSRRVAIRADRLAPAAAQ